MAQAPRCRQAGDLSPQTCQALANFISYWLEEIAQPNLAPKTCEKYELFSRLHIIPHLGTKRLDKLQVRDIRQWLNKLSHICQCCAQGKDASRPEEKRRCCAIGKCCHQILSAESRKDARNVLRAALTCAVEEQLITQNYAAVPRLPAAANPGGSASHGPSILHAGSSNRPAATATCCTRPTSWSWSSGLRKGELLGLTWQLVDLDRAELYIGEQLQRVGRQLLRRETKTEASEAPLPLPDLCVAALKLRRQQQDADRERAGDAWIDTGLVFTTRHGTPIEPRNFTRSFDRRIVRAGVPRITVHGARKTCGSMLAALDVHPARGHADPAAQQERHHDGDLHRGALGCHPRRAQEARRGGSARYRPLLHFAAAPACKMAGSLIETGL